MFNARLAGVLTTFVFLGAGAAHASPSAFPSSVDDSAPFTIPYQGMRSVGADTAGTVFPSSADDYMTFSGSAQGHGSARANTRDQNYSRVITPPATESGSM